jgi:hypothetical protein
MRDALTRAGLAPEIDARVWRRRWSVHVQQIGTGQHATRYLARYVYRVALTNERLDRFSHGDVTFHYTHARTHTTRSMTLAADAFLARFLQHVLPRGFTKIRWYGLLSPGRRKELERARELLIVHSPPQRSDPAALTEKASAVSRRFPGPKPATLLIAATLLCPVCRRGQRVLVHCYHPSRGPP